MMCLKSSVEFNPMKKVFSPSRRRFLKLTLALFALPFLPRDLSASSEDNLVLSIKRDGTRYDIPIVRDNQLDEEGYLKLCYIFKDTHADAAVKMDPQLFIILAKGQKWLASYGYKQPIVITSAYRSPATNAMTEGAARDSLHKYGRAVDIKFNGLPISYLAVVFRSFGATGIGVYDTFLHVDTWKERAWIG